MNILILGGAGFVGSSLARDFSEQKDVKKVVALDNLRRRGSEHNLNDFKKRGISFVHGDVRKLSDLNDIEGQFDLVIEASAEPSVHAGQSGTGLDYLVDTNLGGTLNFLKFVQKRAASGVFLSTSRVYSIPALRNIALNEGASRFELDHHSNTLGLTTKGINENFPIVGSGFRSLYGTTKLSSELFIEEYCQSFKIPVIINRCGVLAGAGQFGKTDQGVFTLWVARHYFQGALSYTGFNGSGKQVRDLLHPKDLHNLINKQMQQIDRYRGETFAVGGGLEGSVSLLEYSKLCAEITGHSLNITSQPETAAVDIPWYVTDFQKAQDTFGWQPDHNPKDIVSDIHTWLQSNRDLLQELFI